MKSTILREDQEFILEYQFHQYPTTPDVNIIMTETDKISGHSRKVADFFISKNGIDKLIIELQKIYHYKLNKQPDSPAEYIKNNTESTLPHPMQMSLPHLY